MPNSLSNSSHTSGSLRLARETYFYDGYYHHPHRPLGIGNTLLFGTLGGVIGHQSGHRDEGILLGAGYGLFRDLFEW